MKVDELPVEILMEIFNYLLTYKKVLLVSRKFYEVACKVHDKNVTLTLDRNFLESAENRPILQSIEASNRKISNLEIDLRKCTEVNKRSIVSVLSKFSETLKHLLLKGDTIRGIEMAYFLEILSLVPNAEHLAFNRLRVNQAKKHKPETSNKEDLNLKHLKFLELHSCDEVFVLAFNRLPAGVLTKLVGPLVSLNTLFSRQANIKILSMDGSSYSQFPAHFLDNLELESLQTWNIEIETAALSRQIKLKSLCLGPGAHVEMKVVANKLNELEELKWTIFETPVNDFVNIRRLKNLKRLSLFGSQPDILSELIQLDNSRIATLEIEDFDNLTIHQIQALAKSAPNLKVLSAYSDLKWEQITAVLNNFNFVESLSFCCNYSEGTYKEYLNQNDSVNAHLTELSFSMKHYVTPILRKMIADFPNLKKLTIFSYTGLTSSNFQLIVTNFSKLESLKLSCCYDLSIDDFKCLRYHRKRLQFLKLWDMDVGFVNEHLKDLEGMFEVVNCSRGNSLLLLKM